MKKFDCITIIGIDRALESAVIVAKKLEDQEMG